MAADLLHSFSPGGDERALDDGRYILVHCLGRGGNAEVYQAWDTRLGVWRAAKVLASHRRNAYGLARFVAEARVMAGLSHPNLVSVTDLHTDDEAPFLIQELVRGGSLYGWLAFHQRGLPVVDAVDAVAQVCDGLAVAHEAGLVHRDVKPHNILVGRGPTYQLTDFGIARLAERGPERNGRKLGTDGFIAPEQQQRPGEVDERADIYALGATLYALVTRRRPPPLSEIERDSSLLRGVPRVLVPVITRATMHHPDHRYRTAEDLAEALRAIAHLLPPRPTDAPPMYQECIPMPTEEATPTGDSQGVRRERTRLPTTRVAPASDDQDPDSILVQGEASPSEDAWTEQSQSDLPSLEQELVPTDSEDRHRWSIPAISIALAGGIALGYLLARLVDLVV